MKFAPDVVQSSVNGLTAGEEEISFVNCDGNSNQGPSRKGHASAYDMVKLPQFIIRAAVKPHLKNGAFTKLSLGRLLKS